MTVRLITRADDELYSLINTAGKFGRAAKILSTLERERAAAPDDLEAAGRLALAQMAALVGMAGDMGAHAIVTEAIESCGRVLALDPDHWFARYARARLRTLAPSSYGSYAVQTDPGLAAARQDLKYLVELQERLPPQAYFTSTYAAAVIVDRLAGVSDRDTLGQLLEVLREGPLEPVGLPAIGAVLCEPLATVYASGGGGARESVGAALAALYGDLPAVTALLRTVPAR